MRHEATAQLEPLELDGTPYYLARDVAAALGISRQTLWRWRRARKVPPGRRLRDQQVVFTRDEVREIRRFANHTEPALPHGTKA